MDASITVYRTNKRISCTIKLSNNILIKQRRKKKSVRNSVYYNIFSLTKKLFSCNNTDTQMLSPQGPEYTGKNTLILDLDETLVHSSFILSPHDFSLDITTSDPKCNQIYVSIRPNLYQFLKRCTELFEVVIFTASRKDYADGVIDTIDREKKIPQRLYRENCCVINENYVKDISRLGRNLNKVVIVDDSPQSYILQPLNAVPIKTWIDDPNDVELLDLLKVLENLSMENDIPQKIKILNGSRSISEINNFNKFNK